MRKTSSASLVGACLVLWSGVATADEILSVKFPHGYRQACSAEAIGHFTAQGPGPITITIVVAPYKSLGWHPNIPISWRSSWWTLKEDFAPSHPLPNAVATRSTQGGKETTTFVDGIPLVIETTYELETDDAYTIDVKGIPQCWAVSHRDYDYWQDGQELHVDVVGGSIVDLGGGEEVDDEEKPVALDLNGGWQTDFGSVVLWQQGSTVSGTYDPDENGTLEATLEGNVLTGYWAESESNEECATERLGTRHWGRIRWTFADGSFEGAYGYCDAEPTVPWNGSRP